MGFFTKLAESLSTGANSTLSLSGILESFNKETGVGTISYAGKKCKIKANPNGKYGLFEVFPYGVPFVGDAVLFNLDSSKEYAILVAPAQASRRGMNYLEIMKQSGE